MTLRASKEAFAKLRAREDELKVPFADPYGRDNWEYERAKKTDPEHQRLHWEFVEARRREQEEVA